MATLTLSGNEITDASRTTNAQGDGRAAPDSSFGIWEATTNLVVNGGFEADTLGAAPATWVALSSTLSVLAAAAKFGTRGMQIATSNLVANEGGYIPFTGAAATYTASAWVLGAGTVQIGIQDNAVMRAVSSPVTLTGAWQRITVTATTLTATAPRVYVQTNARQGIAVYVDGVQCEQKAYATPYVDTTTATATRAAANVQGAFSYLSEVQAWYAVRFRFGAVTGTLQNLFTAQDSSTGTFNRIMLYNDGTTYNITHSRNNVLQTAVTVAGVPTVGTTVTLVAAWTGTTMSLSVNGAAFVSQSRGAAGGTGAQLIQSTFAIGYYSGFFFPDGDVLWACGGIGTLTNADAASLNSYGNLDPVANLQYLNGGVAYPTLIWTGLTSTYNSGGFDPGFHAQRVESYVGGHPDISVYSDKTDAASVYPAGAFYNLSSEVESNLASSAFAPQVGIAGQAYPISSRALAVPRSPMCFDYTAGSRAAGYTAILREDWVHSYPFSPNSYHWLGLCDYQDKGGLGSFMGYGNAAATALTTQISTPTAPSSPSLVVLGATVTAGGTYTAGTPTISFTGGTLAAGGVAATAHAVMNAGGTAVAGIVVDTQGSYSVAPTGITFAGGTFSVTAAATPVTGTGVQFRAICGLLVTYPILVVSGVTVTNGGSYSVPPTGFTFTGGTGGGATGHIVMNGTAIQSLVVDTPGSYTVAPTGISLTGGTGSGAAFTVQSATAQFFGAIDLNLYASAGFPKDLIYTSSGETKVRACVQGISPSWYGFASVDGSTYIGGALALGTPATKTVPWSTVLAYLTTTMDQKVGSNSITPNASSATPYFPIPKSGSLSSVLVKGVNYAIEANLTQTGDAAVIDYSLNNMHTDY
jgi:hypothetical protein